MYGIPELTGIHKYELHYIFCHAEYWHFNIETIIDETIGCFDDM